MGKANCNSDQLLEKLSEEKFPKTNLQNDTSSTTPQNDDSSTTSQIDVSSFQDISSPQLDNLDRKLSVTTYLFVSKFTWCQL